MSRLLCALLVVGLSPVARAGPPDELELAYQREFAYLETQRLDLQQRLQHLKDERAARVTAADRELGDLQAKLLRLQAERTEAEDLLAAARGDREGAAEAKDLVESTLFQAADSLGDGIAIAEAHDPAGYAVALGQAFAAGAEAVARDQRARREKGTYFAEDGTRIDGEILSYGSIAAYGLGDRSGALIPVGEGRLVLRGTDGGADARALASGEPLEKVGIFLVEGREKRVDEAAEKTWASIFAAGGIVGYVILALGAVGLVLCAYRAVSLAGQGRGDAEPTLRILDRGDIAGALASAKQLGGPIGRTMATLLVLGTGSKRRDYDDRAGEALLTEIPRIERFGAAILVIAAVSPLLGLLGTVNGMIGTFDIITEFGTGDPRMLSVGISEALVTTQFGLVVAIPMLLAGNLLNRQAEAVIGRVEGAALAVVNRLAGADRLLESEDDRRSPRA